MLVELGVVEQRFQAVLEVLGGAQVTDAARRYGVARQTVHHWHFDRLLEQALSEIGIEAYVVSTEPDARGVPPLHTLERCLIVKVHGDRISPDLRNSSTNSQSTAKV